jgi:hypothetical protein
MPTRSLFVYHEEGWAAIEEVLPKDSPRLRTGAVENVTAPSPTPSSSTAPAGRCRPGPRHRARGRRCMDLSGDDDACTEVAWMKVVHEWRLPRAHHYSRVDSGMELAGREAVGEGDRSASVAFPAQPVRLVCGGRARRAPLPPSAAPGPGWTSKGSFSPGHDTEPTRCDTVWVYWWTWRSRVLGPRKSPRALPGDR